MAAMALTLSILALLATFYQAYLQRVHNERSVKPLIQIDVRNEKQLISINIQNNGLGPFTLEKLVFKKGAGVFSSIEYCLNLNPSSYQQNTISESVSKVILPGNYHDVFLIRFSDEDMPEARKDVLSQLSDLHIKAEGRDIYYNKIVVERHLDWFKKYTDV